MMKKNKNGINQDERSYTLTVEGVIINERKYTGPIVLVMRVRTATVMEKEEFIETLKEKLSQAEMYLKTYDDPRTGRILSLAWKSHRVRLRDQTSGKSKIID
ncbi:MAG: hypothetical protein ACFFD4_21080 [Candidatus Odinarchaeota archaeon]